MISARLAHIPRGVLPSVPRWVWIGRFLGGATAAFAGGSPFLDVGPFTVGLGGLLNLLRFAALTGVLLGFGGMLSWTTDVADVAPAVAVLGRPLWLVRIPVDEWAVAIALAMRAFPMLLDEFRILYAARRLRPKQILPTTWRGRLRHWGVDVIDLLAAAITVALRRADEMGDAITARRGTRTDLRDTVEAETLRFGSSFGRSAGVRRRVDLGTRTLPNDNEVATHELRYGTG